MNEKLKTCVYVDDLRKPTHQIPGYYPWILIKDYNSFVEYLNEKGIPDLISFDHDLGLEHEEDLANQTSRMGYQIPSYELYKEKTGLDCAKFLCNYALDTDQRIHKVSVHSFNPIGAVNIQNYINGFKKHMGWEQDCWIGTHPFTIEEGGN